MISRCAGLRVLVVEDDAIQALSLRQKLTAAGLEVVGVADDAERALALAAERPPEIAICDFSLKTSITGATVGQLLAAGGVAVIYLTAGLDRVVMEVRDHAVDLLGKPYSDTDLAAALEKACDVAHARSAKH